MDTQVSGLYQGETQDGNGIVDATEEATYLT